MVGGVGAAGGPAAPAAAGSKGVVAWPRHGWRSRAQSEAGRGNGSRRVGGTERGGPPPRSEAAGRGYEARRAAGTERGGPGGQAARSDDRRRRKQGGIGGEGGRSTSCVPASRHAAARARDLRRRGWRGCCATSRSGRRRGRLPRRTRSEVRTAGACGQAKKMGAQRRSLERMEFNEMHLQRATSFNSSMEVLRYRHRTDVEEISPREQWAGVFFFRLSQGQVSPEQGNTRTLQHR